MPECGGSFGCQSTYLITPLTNTAVLSEQDRVGLYREADENRRKQPLDMGKAPAQLWLQGWQSMSPYSSSSSLLEGLSQQPTVLWTAWAFPTMIPMSALAVCEFHTIFPEEGKSQWMLYWTQGQWAMILNLNCDRIRYSFVALPISEDSRLTPDSRRLTGKIFAFSFPTRFLF